MTRTWLTRFLLLAPLTALASAGYAQTPAPSAPETKPAAPAADAATPPPAVTNPVPKVPGAARPSVPAKPANAAPVVHSMGGAAGTAHTAPAPKPPVVAKPAVHSMGGASGTAAPRAPIVAKPAAVAKPVGHPMGGASGTAAPRPPVVAKPIVGAPGTAAAPPKPVAPRPVAPAMAKPAPPAGPAVIAPKPPAAPVARPIAAPVAKPGVAAPVAAVAVAAAPALKPAPELDQLKFLRGRWRCDGKQFATPMFGPEHVFTAIAEGKPMVDGFWDQYTYEERKSKDHHGLKVQGQWGWDQGAKHLVRVAVTNAGDWDSGSAPGLEGDKIVWTGEFSGLLGRMGYRHTFIKKSDKEWSHALELKDPTGKFTPINEVTCKR